MISACNRVSFLIGRKNAGEKLLLSKKVFSDVLRVNKFGSIEKNRDYKRSGKSIFFDFKIDLIKN